MSGRVATPQQYSCRLTSQEDCQQEQQDANLECTSLQDEAYEAAGAKVTDVKDAFGQDIVLKVSRLSDPSNLH